MGKALTRGIALALVGCALLGCGPKTEEQQLQDYMEFYYPSTGSFPYSIVFDWGRYSITTGARTDEDVHPDSEPYRGFITFRPHPQEGNTDPVRPSYVITPQGEVWVAADASSVPDMSMREEVVVEKVAGGTSTQTTVIESDLEPLVDSLRRDEALWKRYGQLTVDGGKTKLTLAEE